MGTYINGVYINDQGQAVDPNTGQPLGGTTPVGIGGATAGPSPIQAQLQAIAAAQGTHQTTPMTAEQLYMTRNPRQAQLNAYYASRGTVTDPHSLPLTPEQQAARDAAAARINQNVENYYQANPQEAAGQLGAIGGVQNDPRYQTAAQPAVQPPVTTPAQGGAAVPFPGGSSIGLGGSFGGTGTTSYTPPAYDPSSATAQNPFLNIGLNAYNQTQQPYNPGYLNDVSKSLWNQATTNLNENIFPGMDSQAITAGGYGGDRSYLAKGVATDRMNQSVFNAMAPQYQQDYNAWQNRALQGGNAAAGIGSGLEQLALNQTIGLGNLGVSQYSADTQRQIGLANANTGQYQADTQRQLGLSDMDIKRYMAESDNAYRAAQAANPQYTNPWAAGIGAAGSLATLWNTLFGNTATTTPK